MKLGLGTAPLGDMFDAVGDETAAATISRAIEVGVSVIDTAPLYGSGLAEERVGRALRPTTGGGPRLSTKVGRVLCPGAPEDTIFRDHRNVHPVHDLSETGIRASLEGSLSRLGVDRVDIALLHDPDDHFDAAVASAFPTMARLRDEGLVGAIGAGMNQSEMLLRFVDEVGIDIVLLAGRWSLLDHGEAACRLLDRCASSGVEVMVGGVFNSGLLAGGTTFDYAPAPAAVLAERDRLAALCGAHDVPMTAAALQFPLRHPAVTTVLVGARTPAEISAAAADIRVPIPDELWERVR